MKKKFRNLQVMGFGALTPALMMHPQAATARAIDPVCVVQLEAARPADQLLYDAAKALLASSISGLSSDETLNLGGDRIPPLSQRWWKQFTPDWARVAQGTTASSACSTGGSCPGSVGAGCGLQSRPGVVGPGKTAVDPALTGGTNAQKIQSQAPQVTEPKVTEPKVTAPAVETPKVNIQK